MLKEEGNLHVTAGNIITYLYYAVAADGRLMKFRVIIMCPAHLLHKWEEFIYEESPYAKVEIIESLSQLTALRKDRKSTRLNSSH